MWLGLTEGDDHDGARGVDRWVEMIEPMTVNTIDQKELAEQLLEQAKEQNIELVGPGGLLGQLTKNVLETALDAGDGGAPWL
jgi:hypothetical protein